MTASRLVTILVMAAFGVIALRWRPSAPRRVASPPVRSARVGLASAMAATFHRVSRSRLAAPSPRAVGEWCDDLARHLRSGGSLHDALITVAPADAATSDATETVRLRLRRGASVVEAVDSVGEQGVSLHLALDMIRISARLGGSAATAIDRTGSTLRQRAADQDERVVQAAQARLSAHVLTAVPLAMLVLLLVVDDDVRAAAATPTGALCIVLGLLLNAAGWTWMRHIVAVRR